MYIYMYVNFCSISNLQLALDFCTTLSCVVMLSTSCISSARINETLGKCQQYIWKQSLLLPTFDHYWRGFVSPNLQLYILAVYETAIALSTMILAVRCGDCTTTSQLWFINIEALNRMYTSREDETGLEWWCTVFEKSDKTLQKKIKDDWSWELRFVTGLGFLEHAIAEKKGVDSMSPNILLTMS